MYEHEIRVPKTRLFNHATQEFYYVDEQVITIVHSLLSISKWEAKWKRPYFSKKPLTKDQLIDYLRCMTITKNVKPIVYLAIYSNKKLMDEVYAYMDDSMSAYFFPPSLEDEKGSRELVTSDLVYYYMTAFNIDFACEKWHINRLIMLIRICSRKSQPKKKNQKMSRSAIAKRNQMLMSRNRHVRN